MNNIIFISRERRLMLSLAALALVILFVSAAAADDTAPSPTPQPIPADINQANADQSDSAEAAAPDWLEPRPLSIVDLISGGLEPSLMAGSPIVWLPSQALLQFDSGSKNGDIVKVNATMLPTVHTVAFCLGQFGFQDQWPISVPESKMRIESNGADITDQIESIEYWLTGLTQPIANTSGLRYETKVIIGDEIKFASDGRLMMPENMGCKIRFKNGASNGGNITIEYEHELTQYISVEIIDQKLDHEFKAYYWNAPQNFGNLTSLNEQIVQYRINKGDRDGRHDFFKFVPPAEANYTVMAFPPTKLDMYAAVSDLEALKIYPGSGTYRLRENKADFGDISIDWITMAGIPLNFHTKESDTSGGQKYLDFFKVNGEYRFHALEVLALDNEYDSCMTNGGCSDALLQTITSDTRMPVDVYYLKVDRIAPGLTQVPLCSVGPAWSTSDAGSKCSSYRIANSPTDDLDVAAEAEILGAPTLFVDSQSAVNRSPFVPQMDEFIWLPMIMNPAQPEPDNPSADCPCGWFTEDGRMLGYVEPPGS
ncbi:MAG: hypothetical protein AB8G95_24145 [Anaerolineae bacterium]